MAKTGEILNGKWKLGDRLVSRSGQGVTFKATARIGGEEGEYVVKVLRSQEQKAIERFKKEIDASLSLQHQHIADIVDFKYEGHGEPYLVTPFYEGGELSKDCVSSLSLLQRLSMLEKVCSALAHAHENRVVHRDIKPANIFLTNTDPAEPKVGDFGLCFFVDQIADEDHARLTSVAEKVGAFHFRPPEADLGRVDDIAPSFDVYSLGKLLYWMVSGGRYLPREAFNNVTHDLRIDHAGYSMHFVYEILKRSVVERPEGRYSNAIEMLDDLKILIDSVEKEARYLDASLIQSCVFCRNGNYEFVLDPHITPGGIKYNVTRRMGIEFRSSEGQPMHNTPINVSTIAGVLVGKCSNCGNVQQFNIDFKLNESTMKHEPQTKWKGLPESKEY